MDRDTVLLIVGRKPPPVDYIKEAVTERNRAAPLVPLLKMLHVPPVDAEALLARGFSNFGSVIDWEGILAPSYMKKVSTITQMMLVFVIWLLRGGDLNQN